MAEQNENSAESLALYVRDYCMYCKRVLMVAEHLQIDLEVRNIWQSDEDERALLSARGRSTVPVLRIERGGVEPQWMGESADIVRYLQRTVDRQ